MLLMELISNPIVFVLTLSALIVSISIHEFAHAYVADKLGDPTPRYLGRVTLNPKAHLDPIGTLMLVFAGIGWGRPVPFNPINLANPKRDSALIALAGPMSNFILAGVLSVIFRLMGGWSSIGFVSAFVFYTALYNIMLGIFNILPFHPLDGFKIVNGLLPHNLSIQWQQMQPYGMYILLFLVITRYIGYIIEPFLSFFMRLFGLTIG
ncbi:site-2 protease family protein [Patescibacteria group bacterium]|nr:site-2 protease family protein [Patescibacteria group bacterium]